MFDKMGNRITKPSRSPRVNRNKDSAIRCYMHYLNATPSPITVYGAKEEGLFYNYDDRLPLDKWNEGAAIAKEKGLEPATVKFYEAVLNHIHDVTTVDIRHILLGCNRSNGHSYLVFGYKGSF